MIGDQALRSIHHDGSGRYVLPLGDEVTLRVRAGLDAPVDRIFLRTTPDGEQMFDELGEGEPGPACRWWRISIRLSMAATGYRFLVLAPGGPWWLNGSGLHRATPTDRDDFLLLAGYDRPGWLDDRVFYQVFPDRFANGDPSNDVTDDAWTYRGQPARHRDWSDPPSTGPAALVDFYGGDLAGIADRLDHLIDLGVNAIYLNPVFATRSNHGYDIIDYRSVAEQLGGDDALVDLRRATAERGIRLVLDIAPNHVGVEHPWFRAAVADPNAPTAEYFVFRDHPEAYESWLGVRALPKLDYRSRALRREMYEGPDSVLRHWLCPPFSIDGWRIDVANMLGRLGPDHLGPEVARGIRAAVREVSPDAYLLGEHWFDAIDQLAGDEWDGVMNYAGFMRPVLEWLTGVEYRSHGRGTVTRTGRTTTRSMVETMTAFRAAVAWSIARNQLNLLGSHDTARIRTVLGGDPGLVRAAFGLLLTYVGVPSIFYGDEVGLEGADDVAARRPMPWDESAWDLEQLAFMRSLVRLRVSSEALRSGGFQVLEVGEDTFAYLRDTDGEWVVVVACRGSSERPAGPLPVRDGAVPDGARFVELFSEVEATVANGMLPLAAMPPGIAIWRAEAKR